MAELSVICLLGQGFEDSEFRVPYDRLRAAGVRVDVVGARAGEELKGYRGKEKIRADRGIGDVRPDEYAALFIPGGYSPDHLRADGYEVQLVPINPPFPRGAGWLKRLRYIRTVATEGLYLPTLRKLRSADVVHVASASYWSFLLAPLPAIIAARRWGKPILLHYQSGEADDHLAN